MSDKSRIHPYVALARETVRRNLSGEPPVVSGDEIYADNNLWRERRACFVSIKTKEGALRGCIGTISPMHSSIDREIMANAASSSMRDPRFEPITTEELEEIVFSVDVLSVPEPVDDVSQLDPRKWGVIVSMGYRRGVLLPDLEGVDTVSEQLEIAARKAGISNVRDASIERFTVDRYREE